MYLKKFLYVLYHFWLGQINIPRLSKVLLIFRWYDKAWPIVISLKTILTWKKLESILKNESIVDVISSARFHILDYERKSAHNGCIPFSLPFGFDSKDLYHPFKYTCYTSRKEYFARSNRISNIRYARLPLYFVFFDISDTSCDVIYINIT